MKKILTIGPVFIVIAALLWAADGVFRISLGSLPPAVTVFYSDAFGFIALLFVASKWFGDLRKMTKKEWIAIAIVALFSEALGTILYTSALQMTKFLPYSVVVILEQQLQPIFGIITAAILLKEKISKHFVTWAAIAIVAVYFTTFKNLTINTQTGSQTIIAAIFAITSGIMWGSSTAISKFVLKKVNVLTATAERFSLGALFALFFIIPQGQAQAMIHLTQMQIWILIAITLTTGMVATAIYYYGLKRTPARVSSICELAFPAAAIFIDYFLYHTTFSLTQVLGLIVLVYSMFQVTTHEGMAAQVPEKKTPKSNPKHK
ncbi:MAG TPA: DMT family transporter [Candidatus Saccharimonadales bacterium]|nr:DMT family transporter [Candidatus Saccharimonadales bacterium]